MTHVKSPHMHSTYNFKISTNNFKPKFWSFPVRQTVFELWPNLRKVHRMNPKWHRLFKMHLQGTKLRPFHFTMSCFPGKAQFWQSALKDTKTILICSKSKDPMCIPRIPPTYKFSSLSLYNDPPKWLWHVRTMSSFLMKAQIWRKLCWITPKMS